MDDVTTRRAVEAVMTTGRATTIAHAMTIGRVTMTATAVMTGVPVRARRAVTTANRVARVLQAAIAGIVR